MIAPKHSIASIHNFLGFVFPVPVLIGGYILLILGIGYLISGNPVGILIALAGAFVSFTFTGVQIDIKNQTFRQYISYFGLKTGKFKDLQRYPFICIFKSNKVQQTYSRSNRAASSNETSYDIYLLNQTHKEKIMIDSKSEHEHAVQTARELANAIGIQVVQYNPEVPSRKNKR